MKAITIFTGVGGLDLGLQRAGMCIVRQCEIDRWCRGVLAIRFPGVKCDTDVRTSQYTEGEADVVAGGSPCVGFSRMGHRAGLADERSGLWREMVRAVRVVRPGVAVLENVVALLERGMGTVLSDLADIGYDAEWDCLPAHAFGVRQSRWRIFVLAHPHRGFGVEPHERTFVPCEVPPSSVIDGQPVPNGMRVDKRPSDRVDVGRRIGACANIVVPQVAEYIGRLILDSVKEPH